MKLKEAIQQSYRGQSPRLGAEETINLTLETHENQGVKKFYHAPGLQTVYREADEFPVTAMLQVFSDLEVNPEDRDKRVFALIGGSLYEFDFFMEPTPGAQPELIARGSPYTGILSNGGRTYMVANPQDTQLVFVTDRQKVYKVESAAVAELDWFGVPITQVALINSFYLFLAARGDGFFFAEPGDAGAGDPLNFVSVEGSSNHIIAIVVDRNVDIWLFGTQATQIFYNDRNDPDAPFKPNQSAFIETGIAGPNLAAAYADRVFWIDENYVVRASKGYLPERISTHAIENELRTYGDISDAYVWTATWNGHNVIRWTFPSANVDLRGGKVSKGMTWQYDATENDWTRALSWDNVNGWFVAHRAMSSCEPIFGQQLVGDRENGKLYILSPDKHIEDCERVPWLRRFPVLEAEGHNVSYPWLRLGMQTGVNPTNSECSGTIIESYHIPFEMVFPGWLFADGEETDYTSTQIEVDPADFDGLIVAAVFQATADAFGTGFSASVSLMHTAESESLATLTWDQDVLENELKVADFTPSSSAGAYYIRVEASDGDLSATFFKATIVYRNPTKFWVQRAMITGDASTGGFDPENDLLSYTVDTTETTYTTVPDSSSAPFNIWEKDSTKYDEIDKWQVRALGWSQWNNLPTDADVASIALFNKTDDVMVTGSELTFDEIVPTTKTADLADSAANFTDGDEFEFRIKCATGNGGFWSQAGVWVHVINYRKAEIPLTVNNVFGSTEVFFGIECRSLIDPSWFPEGTTYTYELTAIGDDMDESLARLQKSPADYGNINAVGTAGAIEVIQGDVTNPENIITNGSGIGYGVSDTAAEQIIVEITDFTWNIPVIDPIENASVVLQGGPYDQTAAMAAKLNSESYVSHSEGAIEFTGPPANTYIYHGLSYDFGSSFTATDFDNPVVRLRATQPANTTETEYHWRAWGGLIFVLMGDPVVELDFTGDVTATRQESAAFDLDVDNDRWFVSSSNLERGFGYILAQTENPNAEGAGEPFTDDETIIQETNPLVYLKYSNNWGQTYSNELYRGMGHEGDYRGYLKWDRLGSGTCRVFEIGGNGAVPVAIDGVYIDDPEVLKS